MNDPLEALLQMMGDTNLYPPNSRYHGTPRALLAGAVIVAAPLAALTLIPGGTKEAEKTAKLAAPKR